MNVRITEITIENFKNVLYGKISLDNPRKSFQASATGLYGQNGSGKTALINALELLRYVLCGQSIPDRFADYINVDAEKATLSFEFRVEMPEGSKTAAYKFDITGNSEEESNIDAVLSCGRKVTVQNETLRCPVKFGKTSRMGRIIDTNDNSGFAPSSKMLLLAGKQNETEITVARQLAAKTSRSFIFSKEFLTVIKNNVENKDSHELKFYVSLIKSLAEFGNYSLFTVTTSNTGLISLNAQPLIYRQKEEIKTLMLPIEAPIIIRHDRKELAEKVIGSINIVLKQIVPDLTIGIEQLGTQAMNDGETGDIIQLMSCKNRIPLKNESEGIKKIISILNLLIAVYNQPSITVAIDELDTGIFEYLLGELLRIISEKGKGQLIFTSHNLRPLETLDKGFVAFTTTNPNRRYVRMTNIRNNNNLRDIYYKDIMLGQNGTELYRPTNNAEIAFAFREADEYDGT